MYAPEESGGDPLNICKGCIFVKFDEDWGEYICMKRQHRIPNPSDYTRCKFYEKAEKKEGDKK